jgi:hypothetical protein
MAGLEARLDSVAKAQEVTQEDAREARDVANRITTILQEQNINVRLTEIKTEMRQAFADARREARADVDALRTDVVLANTRLKTELDAAETRHRADQAANEARFKTLETDLTKRAGMKDLIGWLMKNAPWLFAGAAAFAAGLGFKDRIT